MSEKYRRLAGLSGSSGAGGLDDPAPCEACGYDLRGRPKTAACPECGTLPRVQPGPGRVDPFLALDSEARARVRLGAFLAATGLLIVAVEPLASMLLGVLVALGGIPGSSVLPVGVRLVRLLACGLWIVAAFAVAPPAIWRGRRVLGPAARGPVLGLLVGWGVGQVLMVIVARDAAARPIGAPPQGWIELLGWVAAALRLVGGLAAAAVLLVVAGAAEDAELEPHADRLLAGAFVLPGLGLIIWIIPNSMPWFAVLAYLLLFLLPWAWCAWRTGTGMLGVARHLGWVRRLGEQATGRDERIAARRAAIDAAVRSRVRPLPGAAAGATCSRCGGSVPARARDTEGRCPACRAGTGT